MNIRFHSSVIITNDIAKLKKFYCDDLKLEVEFDFGTCISLRCGLSLWKLSDSHAIAKKTGRIFCKDGNKNLELCFETENFDPVFDRLKELNVELLHEVIEESWGQKTIRFYDPESNLIEIGESIPCFVKRLHISGLTAIQVSEKTSVPLEAVQALIRTE